VGQGARGRPFGGDERLRSAAPVRCHSRSQFRAVESGVNCPHCDDKDDKKDPTIGEVCAHTGGERVRVTQPQR
jgi:hypothetical protein